MNNLSEELPDIKAQLISKYEKYAKDVNLIAVPDDYNPLVQMQKNVARNQADEITDTVPVSLD